MGQSEEGKVREAATSLEQEGTGPAGEDARQGGSEEAVSTESAPESLTLAQQESELQFPPPQKGEVEVTITADNLQAFLTVTPPQPGGAPADRADVQLALDKAGVLFGIDEGAITKALETGARPIRLKPRPVLIATGEPPVRGQDAVITYADPLSAVGGVPVELADGSVDFFNLNVVRNVIPETVLATKTPPSPGTPGTGVTGEPLRAEDGLDMPWKAGDGARLSDDGMQILAAIDGHAWVNEREMVFAVSPVFEVRADVGPETGSIDFNGTVIVRGSILGGYYVKATQDLEVQGGIDGGSAEIGGNITVRYGIQGAGRGKIVSAGNVTCRFMENAHVQAKGDITVTDGILHSIISAGGKITAPGRKGLIVGGQVRAKEQIVARVVGSSLATPTEVEVGTDPAFKDKVQKVTKALQETEESIKKTYQVINLLKDMETNRPAEFSPTRRDTLVKAAHSLRRLVEQQEALKAEKAGLEADAQLAINGTIKVSDVVFPGVRVTIWNSTFLVADTLRGGNFYFSTEEGHVKVG